MTYVPQTSEGFLRVEVDPPQTGETATRYFVGTTPRLTIRDEDGGYARIVGGDDYISRVVSYLAPFTFNPAQPLTVEAQVRFSGTWALGTSVAFSFGAWPDGELPFIITGGETVFDLSIGPWHDVSLSLSLESWALAYAQAGQLFLAVYVDLLEPETYDVSFLRLRGGHIPTRVYPRADGLGMGAPRIMDNRSPYTSPRVFGMI